MINLALPFEPNFIWTADWDKFASALERETVVRRCIDDKLDYPRDFSDPLLTIVQATNLRPIYPHLRSKVRNVAMAVPMECFALKRYIQNAYRNWDYLVTSSTWSAEMFQDAGYPHVSVVVHPAPEDFTPEPYEVKDDFVIYSGGKMEMRKSQDIVIQAVGYLMRKHKDIRLIVDWHNPWPETAESIRATALFQQYPNQHTYTIMRACGVDLKRVYNLPTQHSTVAQHLADKLEAIRLCDVGLFPNRAESTANAIMCQVMACGRAVIALYAHGHKEVLDEEDPLNLTCYTPFIVANNRREDVALWYEPSVDETIAKLEFAYDHRQMLPALGMANSLRLEKFQTYASRYVEICEGRSTNDLKEVVHAVEKR